MNAEEFNKTVSLVLQELDKSVEKSLIILPAPAALPSSIDLKQLARKIAPQNEADYTGSMDVEERGLENNDKKLAAGGGGGGSGEGRQRIL